MRGVKLLVFALVATLLAGSVGIAEATLRPPRKKAKKPKKIVKIVPKPVTFYLGTEADSDCQGEGAAFLSTTATTDGEACGNNAYGIIAEALITGGQEEALDALPAGGLSALPTTYTAVDGVPFSLDGKKDIAGEIVVVGNTIEGKHVAAGKSKLVIGLTGTTAGESTPIGEVTVEYDITPGEASTVDFTIPATTELGKAKFTSLELNLRNRGTSVGQSFYSGAGDSMLTIPALIKKVIRR